MIRVDAMKSRVLLSVIIIIFASVLLPCNLFAVDVVDSVTASTDDAGHTGGGPPTWSTTSAYSEYGERGGAEGLKGGFRIVALSIPQGATIGYCSTSVIPLTTRTDVVDVTFYCEDTADATTFGTETDFDDRFKTTASVDLTDSITWTNESRTTLEVDLAGPLQELVNRSDWASGNDAVFIWNDNSSTAGNYKLLRSYDLSAVNGQKIWLSYTDVEAEGSVLLIMGDDR